jgi:hypothetical protein
VVSPQWQQQLLKCEVSLSVFINIFHAHS